MLRGNWPLRWTRARANRLKSRLFRFPHGLKTPKKKSRQLLQQPIANRRYFQLPGWPERRSQLVRGFLTGLTKDSSILGGLHSPHTQATDSYLILHRTHGSPAGFVEDLVRSDKSIHDRIQEPKDAWTQIDFDGQKSQKNSAINSTHMRLDVLSFFRHELDKANLGSTNQQQDTDSNSDKHLAKNEPDCRETPSRQLGSLLLR